LLVFSPLADSSIAREEYDFSKNSALFDDRIEGSSHYARGCNTPAAAGKTPCLPFPFLLEECFIIEHSLEVLKSKIAVAGSECRGGGRLGKGEKNSENKCKIIIAAK